MAKVLIVDDSSLGRKLLKRILIKTEHEVIAEAENGEEGILQYKKVKPEIVTMDVDMPGINGLEASMRILKYHPEARIVIISAHEQNDLKAEMEKYGLRHYIIKPINEQNIKAVFQNALSDNGNKIAVEAPNNVIAEKASEAKGSDIKVYVSHHSVMKIFAAIKKGEEGKISSIEIEKEIHLNDFVEEDPIVLVYESNGVQLLSLCEIANVDTVNRALMVEEINSYPLEVETIFQNFPASMYIDIRVISTRKRHPAIIKTFMVNEIVFKSKADFDDNEKVSFDIYYKNKMLSIDGMVISKTQGRKNVEYILKLDFSDYNMKKMYMTYLQELASKLKNSLTDSSEQI